MSGFEPSFSVVTPTLAGCAAPGLCGQPIAVDRDILRSRGVIALVSLNETELDWPALAPLAHLREPLRDYFPPTLDQMVRIAEFWRAHRASGLVCVHCNAGMGRTGTVLCCLALCEDPELDADAVLAKVRRQRRGSAHTTKQEDFVRAWASSSLRFEDKPASVDVEKGAGR